MKAKTAKEKREKINLAMILISAQRDCLRNLGLNDALLSDVFKLLKEVI